MTMTRMAKYEDGRNDESVSKYKRAPWSAVDMSASGLPRVLGRYLLDKLGIS